MANSNPMNLSVTDKAKWEELISIAVRLSSNDKWPEFKKHQRRFVRFVDYLRSKYGNTASLLATRADMMNRDSAKVPYLLKAHKLAVKCRDHKEMVYTADSLATIYVYQPDLRSAIIWLAKLKRYLGKYRDKQCEQSCRDLERELKYLGSKSPGIQGCRGKG